MSGVVSAISSMLVDAPELRVKAAPIWPAAGARINNNKSDPQADNGWNLLKNNFTR